MAKNRYWNGTSWEVIGTDASKVWLTDGLTAELAISDLRSLKISKTVKDAEGIFTTVERRRKSDNTLAIKSVLSGGTSPNYTTRTVTFYATNGTTVIRTDTFTLTYDTDGVLISEV